CWWSCRDHDGLASRGSVPAASTPMMFAGSPVDGFGLADYGSVDISRYVQSQGGGSYSVNTAGIAQAFDARNPTFGQILEASLDKAIELDAAFTIATGALVLSEQSGLDVALTTAGAAIAGDTAAEASLAVAGASVAGIGLAVSLAPLVLLSAWPAQA